MVSQPSGTVTGVIASDRQAAKVGSALLVVDGTDEVLVRKAEFAIRPTRNQAHVLERGLLQLSRDSYNAALQHRRDAWRWARVSVTTFEQFAEIDEELRQARPEITRFGIQPVRSSIRRADEAMAGFFRRVKDAETRVGYPRFKSHQRWHTAFYDEPVSWALRRIGPGETEPFLYLQGIGEIELSGSAARQLRRLIDRGGEARTLSLTKLRSGGWRACVGFRGVRAEKLQDSNAIGALDRGVTVTAALPDGSLLVMPRFLADARDKIAALQCERETKKKFSAGWKKDNRAIAKAYRKARHQSENWARHTAKEIVGRYGVIALERLDLTNMTKSAKGTIERPGKNVKAKSALNRSLQDAALGRLGFWVCVKAEEAGRRVWKVDPRYSSQECVACGHTERANRVGCRFACTSCGHRAHADVNAAQVLTCRGAQAEALWRELGSPANHRPEPRLRRRKGNPLGEQEIMQYGAGSAPHAVAV